MRPLERGGVKRLDMNGAQQQYSNCRTMNYLRSIYRINVVRLYHSRMNIPKRAIGLILFLSAIWLRADIEIGDFAIMRQQDARNRYAVTVRRIEKIRGHAHHISFKYRFTALSVGQNNSPIKTVKPYPEGDQPGRRSTPDKVKQIWQQSESEQLLAARELDARPWQILIRPDGKGFATIIYPSSNWNYSVLAAGEGDPSILFYDAHGSAAGKVLYRNLFHEDERKRFYCGEECYWRYSTVAQSCFGCLIGLSENQLGWMGNQYEVIVAADPGIIRVVDWGGSRMRDGSVDDLLAALQLADPNVKMLAIDLLIDRASIQAREPLVTLYSAPDTVPGLRLRAAVALLSIGDQRGVPQLLESLSPPANCDPVNKDAYVLVLSRVSNLTPTLSSPILLKNLLEGRYCDYYGDTEAAYYQAMGEKTIAALQQAIAAEPLKPNQERLIRVLADYCRSGHRLGCRAKDEPAATKPEEAESH